MRLFYLMIFCVLAITSCEPPSNAGQSTAVVNPEVRPQEEDDSDMDQKDERINSVLTGFNAEYMTDVCIDGNFENGKMRNVTFHKDCSSILEALDPEVLRWPGGITAQYYHFDGTGYGFNPASVKGTEYDGNALKLQAALDINFIELFAEMARGRKVVFVANLLDGNYEENMRAVRYLEEQGADVIGIELGNEFYFGKMDPNEYLRRCQPYIEGIQDIKIAVHMAPDMGPKNKNWNKVVSKANVDAFVIHEYNRKIKNFCKGEGKPYFDCALKQTDEFIDGYIHVLLGNYKRNYGDKEIWLSEWNVAPRTWPVYGTWLKSYHNFKMMSRIQELDLEMALFHNLVTGGPMYSVAYRKKGELHINSDFYVHQMLSKGKYLGKANVAGCQVWYYHDRIAFANTSGETRQIPTNQLKGGSKVSFTEMDVLEASSLDGEPTFSSMAIERISLPPYSVAVVR